MNCIHRLSLSMVFLTMLSFAHAQKISSIDIYQSNKQFEKEVQYFYEQNWKLFREEALRSQQISGYQLLKTAADSLGNFKIILVTEYPDSASFKNREAGFRPIIQKLRPTGPVMLNDKKRNEILQVVGNYDGAALFRNGF